MKTVSLIISVLCLCLVSLQGFTADQGAVVDKLSAQEKAIWEAIKAKNWDAFSAATAPDILDVDASGAIFTKKQLIDTLGSLTMTDFALTDFKTYSLDKDCIVLSYTSVSNGSFNGHPMVNVKVTNTTTYVNAGGKWWPKAHTETQVREMAAAPKQ